MMIDPVIFIDLALSFVTLTLLEIALGIDNLVMIMILCGRLPKSQQSFARKVGLGVALLTRVMLLSLLFWMKHMVHPLFDLFGHPVSVQTILYFFGGLFLIAKATAEIHHDVEDNGNSNVRIKQAGLFVVLAQISMVDIVFSFDSVLTAIGLAEEIAIMVAAVVIATIVMVAAVDKVSGLLEKHPTLKILALSYMILIGVALLAEAFEFKIPKGYLYSAMAFSIMVEWINIMVRGSKEKRMTKAPIALNILPDDLAKELSAEKASTKKAVKKTAKKAVKKVVKKATATAQKAPKKPATKKKASKK